MTKHIKDILPIFLEELKEKMIKNGWDRQELDELEKETINSINNQAYKARTLSEIRTEVSNFIETNSFETTVDRFLKRDNKRSFKHYLDEYWRSDAPLEEKKELFLKLCKMMPSKDDFAYHYSACKYLLPQNMNEWMNSWEYCALIDAYILEFG